MGTYTVWITFNKQRKEIKDVIGDGVMPDTFRMRWFLLKDLTRIEYPMDNSVFEFSPEREQQRIARTNVQPSGPALVSNTE